MKEYNLENLDLTKYLFFTGKGGVGKTSVACATAVNLADNGKKALLVSTDPASNLQDVFKTDIDGKGKVIEDVKNLTVVNVDPMKAAEEYRESVVLPYRGKLPDEIIRNMEEQLSGSCTVEIASFNEFTRFLADKQVNLDYDYIIFDTAPTGHTLRMLQLPSAWSNFISESTHGASCLGQLSGLDDKKEIYKKAVDTLCDGKLTTLVLVTRPDIAPLKEASRASKELSEIGVCNQILIVNGLLASADDDISSKMQEKQLSALGFLSDNFTSIATYSIPLRSYNLLGIENLRNFFTRDSFSTSTEKIGNENFHNLNDVIEDLFQSNKRVIFTMGKGGVGKTTVAGAIAVGLSARGKKVHLTTTDPAHHLQNVLSENDKITMSFIDEKAELKAYQNEVLDKARESMAEEDLAYIEEDLRSPCTQEIAVFRAFANVVDKASEEIVVIDTAPTGHTLLLLDSTQSYSREVSRNTGGEIPQSVRDLLPRLKDKAQTEVVIVTLPEATPVYEALRLEEDLKRAEISVKWWVVNSSYYKANSTNSILKSKASGEIEWINKVTTHSNGNTAVIKWYADEIKDEKLKELIKE